MSSCDPVSLSVSCLRAMADLMRAENGSGLRCRVSWGGVLGRDDGFITEATTGRIGNVTNEVTELGLGRGRGRGGVGVDW